MNIEWNELIIYILRTFISIVLSVGIPYLFTIIGKQAKTDIQAKYLKRAEEMIHDAVVQVQQTYVDDLKAENLFDHDAQVYAFNRCRDAVLKSMSAKMQDVIKEAVGDFETYLKNKIEAEVYYNKGGVLNTLSSEIE